MNYTRQILNYIKKHPDVTKVELAEALGIPKDSARSALKRLRESGRVTVTRQTPGYRNHVHNHYKAK